MLDIKNDCIAVQKYIKKSKSTLEVFMYSPAGITFIIMTPFVMGHKKYFNKVQLYEFSLISIIRILMNS